MSSGRPISRREAVTLAARVGAGVAAVGAVPVLSRCSLLGPERQPNILFVFTDDHAPHAISAYGSRINSTPNIDRLADEGAVFENSFCTNSICAPSRAVILTGKHSHVNGKIDNSGEFDMTQPTFNKFLQRAGYQTAVIGKWHLRVEPAGFDYWYVLPGQGHYYNPDFRTPEGTVRNTGYVTDIITDLSIDWLRAGRDPDRPFLLMCQHKAPHRNWMPGPDHLSLYENEDIPEPDTLFDDYSTRASGAAKQEMSIASHFFPAYDLKITPPSPDNELDRDLWNAAFDRMTGEQQLAWNTAYGPRNDFFHRTRPQGRDRVRYFYQRYIKDYLRCIASIDDNVGRLLDYLDESGLANDTIVIYSSDQGFYLGEHGWYDKRWMYEESLRMPFVARWPGRIEPGIRVPQMIQNIDYAPTFLDVAGIEIPGAMQGVSLVPLMRGQAPRGWRSAIYYHYYEFPGWHMVAKHYGVRTAQHKLIYYYETDEWELFDLEADPHELHNLYSDPASTAIVTELKSELRRLRSHYGDTTGTEFAG
jgi:arylsulfatase A-like enzyme